MGNVFRLNGTAGDGPVIAQQNGRWTVQLSIRHWDHEWLDRMVYLALDELDAGSAAAADGLTGAAQGNESLGVISCRVFPGSTDGYHEPGYAGPWFCELLPIDPHASPPSYLSAPTGSDDNPDTFDLQFAQPGGGWSEPIRVPIRGERAGTAVEGATPAPSADAATPAPSADAATPAPSTGAATPAPSTGAATPAPSTDAATPAPSADAATPAPSADTATPTPSATGDGATGAGSATGPPEGDCYEIDFTFKNPREVTLAGVHYAAHSAIAPRRTSERGPRRWVRLQVPAGTVVPASTEASTAPPSGDPATADGSASSSWSEEAARNCELQARLYYHVLAAETELGEPLADDPGHVDARGPLRGIRGGTGLASCPRPRDGQIGSATSSGWRRAFTLFQQERGLTPADGDPARALEQLRAATSRFVPAWYGSQESARSLATALGQGAQAVRDWYQGLSAAGDTRDAQAREVWQGLVQRFVQLPRSVTGLRLGGGPGAQWGLPETIDLLQRIGEAWERQRDADRGAGRVVRPAISIGEISQRAGGPFPPHSTHQLGVDVDLSTPRADGGAQPAGAYTSSAYSRDFTRDLIQLILDTTATGPVQTWVIWFNDQALWADFPGRVVQQDGHDDHLHLKLHHPLTDPLYGRYGLIQSARAAARRAAGKPAPRATSTRDPHSAPRSGPRSGGH